MNPSYPLTQSQMLIWAGQQLKPDLPHYNMMLTFDMSGVVDTDHFRAAFQELIKRADALRLVFTIEEGIPKQRFLKNIPFKLDFVDLSETGQVEEAFKIWLEKRKQIVFDLSQRAFDTALVKLSEKRFVWYLNQHHLITDAHACALLYKAMAELYKCSLAGILDTFPQLPSYKDYINYENEKRHGKELETAQQFWKEKLAEGSAFPRLYSSKRRLEGNRFERKSINLGTERTTRLYQLAEEKELRAFTKNLSLYNIFATLIFAYLYRVSGQRAICIGTQSQTRPTTVFKETPGLFTESFLLGADIQPGDGFVSLLQRLQPEVYQLLRYAQSGCCSVELSRAFNVVLNFSQASFSDFNGIPMHSEFLAAGFAESQYDLWVQVNDFDASGNFRIDFDMNCHTFDKRQRDLIPQHFLNLLDQFLFDPYQQIDRCNILSPAERHAILEDFNQTHVPYPNDMTIPRLFEEQVNRTSNNVAVSFESHQLSYKELNDKANQVGHWLMKKGVGPDSVVGIIMDRSLEMLIGILGILKSGGAYLPIEAKYPEDRIAFMVKDTGAKLFLVQEHLRKIIPAGNFQSIALDTEWDRMEGESKQNPITVLAGKNLCYLFYTSGSTGLPKGVMVRHEGVCNAVKWRVDEYPLTSKDKKLQQAPYSFDTAVTETFWALFSGAHLVLAKPEGHKDCSYLVQTIIGEGITAIHFLPSILRLFLEEKNVKNCRSLRMVFSGGEALSLALKNRCHELLEATLINMYGPTETSIKVTHCVLEKNSDDDVVPIGRPISNVQTYILGPGLQPVPIGCVGELMIGGIQLAKGYLNRPKLTEQFFIPHPFSNVPGERLYRTGDMARYRSDGVIEFLGRVDHQVKLRGFRIELGEIEAALNKYPEVTESVVTVKENELGEQQLVAFYVGLKELSSKTMRAHLAKILPEYMIPAFYLKLDKIPLTAIGKADLKSLPEPIFESSESEHEFTPPRNEIEKMMASIWEEVLGIERIGIHDDFLELGGHSLKAIRLLFKINDAFDLSLPVNTVFEHRSIAAISKHVEETIVELLESEN